MWRDSRRAAYFAPALAYRLIEIAGLCRCGKLTSCSRKPAEAFVYAIEYGTGGGGSREVHEERAEGANAF